MSYSRTRINSDEWHYSSIPQLVSIPCPSIPCPAKEIHSWSCDCDKCCSSQIRQDNRRTTADVSEDCPEHWLHPERGQAEDCPEHWLHPEKHW